MIIRIFLASFALVTASLGASAQELQTRPWREWPIYRQVIIPQQKILPPGFYRFQPVSSEMASRRYQGNSFVVCREDFTDLDKVLKGEKEPNPAANAIAFAQKLYEGHSPLEAIDAMKRAHGGDVPCGFYSEGYYKPTEASVRGDSKGRRVFILRLRDVSGTIFFMGVPDPD